MSALEKWMDLLGREHVHLSPSELSQAETATFETGRRIPAILTPASRDEVAACLRIANENRTPVYPISSGKNWGYGSRVPTANDCALLDLRRLNRILDYNEELAYITVEAGVTQAQLLAFLQERGGKLWMDATGAGPDCSIIGNLMERGFGHTPYGEHFSFCCGYEVVLPDGEIVRTGGARHPGSKTGAVNRYGAGPVLDGLFTQSNLGVVTSATIWLMPKPDSFGAFFFRVEDPNGLPTLIEAIRELRLRDILRSAAHIANDYKVLNGLQQYPWAEMNGKTPLMPADMAKFRKDLTIGYWNVAGGLYGTPKQVAEAKRVLKRTLARVPGKLKFVDDRLLRTAKRFAGPVKMLTGWDLARTAAIAEPVIGLMKGIPTKATLPAAYWRMKTPVPANPDPDRDRCGLLWYAPVAPATGKDVTELTSIVNRVMLDGGYEPLISITTINPRAVNCVISLHYDRAEPGEDEKAMNCYQRLVKACNGAGYFPYRLGIASMHEELGAEHERVLAKIKNAVDPNHVLAPGRYER